MFGLDVGEKLVTLGMMREWNRLLREVIFYPSSPSQLDKAVSNLVCSYS